MRFGMNPARPRHSCSMVWHDQMLAAATTRDPRLRPPRNDCREPGESFGGIG